MEKGRLAKGTARYSAGVLTLVMILCAFFSYPAGRIHAEPSTETGATGTEIPSDVASFPESYQAALMSLKEKHPNWYFEPLQTGSDWNTAISKELKDGKSLIYKTFPACVREGLYDQGNWYFASRAVLEYFMDPRNGLTEDAIFQFEHLAYQEQFHTLDALESFLEGTFMNSKKTVPHTSMTYAFLIYAIGSHPDVQVSPFHLAARVLQEQGQGKSALISGTYPGYEGYYNYFNIGATGTTNKQVIENGLEYAKNNWGKQLGNDPEQGAYNALWGGSNYIASAYIKKGQDTLYLQKFNVNPNSSYALYSHQYMQNITAPMTEARSIRNLYASENALDSSFVFRIPVFQNMPEQACPMPTASTNVVLEIPFEVRATKVKIDDVDYEGEIYFDSKKNQIRMIVTMPDENAKKASLVVRNLDGEIKWEFYWDLQYVDNHYAVTEATAPPQEEPVVLTNDVSLTLPDGVTASEVWLDGVPYTGTIQDGKLCVTAKDETAQTAEIYLFDTAGVPQDMLVWTLSYGEKGYEATYQPEMRGLLSYHGFSIRIKGKSGIRVKTGIGKDTREKLLSQGIDGYRLKEYGTLAMIDANREKYPMVKGGEKTISGMAYGTSEDGTRMDAIYETVNERYRFTSVLTGLPSEQYKTDFAFRGYLILEKDGKEQIIYGPVVAKSIYNLAVRLIDMQYYETGSDAYLFLRRLICDADGIEFEEDLITTENEEEEGGQSDSGSGGEKGNRTAPKDGEAEGSQTDSGSGGEKGNRTAPKDGETEGSQTDSGSGEEKGSRTTPENAGEESGQASSEKDQETSRQGQSDEQEKTDEG